ncbi:glycosyltransferase [Enterobacter sp.]|uniref:glycosyltransferase n=1 Tax=Enterobacter sp. TaxID=42895 RepID=UPI00296F9DBC|nr:glycosyltransferase [Enterobacter sp.]
MKIYVLVLNACDLGGIERSSFTLVNTLKHSGYDAEIVSLHENAEIHIDANEQYRLLPGKNEVHKLWDFLKTLPPDTVLISAYDRISFYLSLLRKFTKKRFMLIAHQHADYYAHKPRVRFLRKYSYRLGCDAVVCLTKKDNEYYSKWFSKVYTIPNILDVNFATDAVNEPIAIRPVDFVAAGRLHQIKRFTHFLKLHDYIKNYRGVTSKLFGHGEEYEHLLSSSPSAAEVLSGKSSDIFRDFQKSKFLIVTSERESFSMVIIEAMAAGCVVVSYDCPTGPAELIDNGVNGFLIENGDLQALKEKCLTLLDDHQLCDYISKNAVASSKKFYPDAVVNSWKKVFSMHL